MNLHFFITDKMLLKRVIEYRLIFLTLLFMFVSKASAEPLYVYHIDSKRWIGYMHGTVGRPFHIWSAKTYKGYKNVSNGIFMEWETDALIPFSQLINHTLRIELRYLNLWGTIELKDDQVPEEEWLQGGPFYTTLNHKRFSTTVVRRWIIFSYYYIRPTIHLGLGMSWTDKEILKEGTNYNFDFVGGFGIEFDVTNKLSGNIGARWEHFSNGGAIYFTNKRVIGPESINLLISIKHEI
ncbi:MAG: acyloxyacyl hydrolase [Deltaproteobacteria bacterium]|nr:acyloxyacyl hydrolase [Deltaproteobacteria bacterium]